MSLDATRWAWQQRVTPTQKLVLLSLADRANEQHECYPSNARLQFDTGMDRKTIYSAICALEAGGLLAVSRSMGGTNKYQLVGIDGRETSAGNGTSTQNGTSTGNGTSTQNGTSTGNGTSASPKNGTIPSQKRHCHQSQKRDSESTTESTNNLPDESANTPAQARAPKLPAIDGVDQQVVADYLAVRKAKRAGALTDTALNGLRREAQAAGLTLQQALMVCCERNWVGFRADWFLGDQRQGAPPGSRGTGETNNYRNGKGNIHDQRAATIAALTGRNQQRHDENTIEGVAVRVD